MKSKIALISVLVLFLFSCDSYKQVPYFQDLDRSSAVQQDIKNFSPYTIQPSDIIGLYITSAANPESAMIFNFNLNRVNGIIGDNSVTNPIVGHLVDAKGYIQMPLLGQIKVAGYTTSDLKDQLLKSLGTYIKDPVVNVRIMNFKISVMGDVLRPDIYTFQTESVNIAQALAQAGDLNITARRDRLLLIRERDGKREFIPLDLTSKKLFESPYYYLKNNDILYVDPDRTKYATVSRGYRSASLAIGILSAAAVITTIFLYKK